MPSGNIHSIHLKSGKYFHQPLDDENYCKSYIGVFRDMELNGYIIKSGQPIYFQNGKYEKYHDILYHGNRI